MPLLQRTICLLREPAPTRFETLSSWLGRRRRRDVAVLRHAVLDICLSIAAHGHRSRTLKRISDVGVVNATFCHFCTRCSGCSRGAGHQSTGKTERVPHRTRNQSTAHSPDLDAIEQESIIFRLDLGIKPRQLVYFEQLMPHRYGLNNCGKTGIGSNFPAFIGDKSEFDGRLKRTLNRRILMLLR